SGGAAAPAEMYEIPNRRQETLVVRLPRAFETPLRTGNLRDPNGPQVTFAFESFIDELAAAAEADPVQFRLDLIDASTEDDVFRKARSIATIRAAAERFGWDTRPSPKSPSSAAAGPVVTGRGIAYTYRSGTIVTTIAEVDVNRNTGHVHVKRLVCAHDCGLVINPQGLRHTVECGMLHGLSRALWEEVQFDDEKVTSVDWASHPTLRHSDTPNSIEVIIVNGDPRPDRADLPPYGAGEASHKPMIAAVANAIHDATGVRLRRVPFRRERVLEALRAAST
ncbi:MAG: molybdopterin cofactor-binding domain-containing protein, partial [Gammaproteobacteria bacterium]